MSVWEKCVQSPAPSRPILSRRAAPARPSFNSMYLDSKPIVACLTGNRSIVWLLGTTHYSGRGDRVACSPCRCWRCSMCGACGGACGARGGGRGSAAAPGGDFGGAELPGTLLRQGRQGRTSGLLARLCHGSEMFVSTPSLYRLTHFTPVVQSHIVR